MEKDSEKNEHAENNLRERFDQVLCRHIERLLGTGLGIEGLPLNLATIPSLILLAERETEIESFPYLPPPRYNEETIIAKLSENNLEPGEDEAAAIQDMIEKAYIEVAKDGRFFAQKPTISMSKLLDRVFPNMPGINLIAYLGQIVDEVLMGRKVLDSAVDQLDQMFKMQGAPLKKEKNRQPTNLKSEGSGGPKTAPRSFMQGDKIEPSDIYSHIQTVNWGTVARNPPPEAPAPSSSKDLGQLEIKEVEIGDLSSQGDPSQDHPTDMPDEMRGSKTEALEDDIVDRQIAAFEEDLGLACPMCKQGKITFEETARGKPFYRCSQNQCTFMSWGKPYYLSCPQCGNPFLIETLDGAGKAILKCPRATCLYWQETVPETPGGNIMAEKAISTSQEDMNSPAASKKPRRRVVRRRVVRRKK